MRTFILFAAVLLLLSCNNTANKQKTEVMDDTARMERTDEPAQAITAVNIMEADLPKGQPMTGLMKEAWKWNDKQGENIFVLTAVPPYDDKKANQYGEEGQTAELYAYHYVKTGNDYKKIWQHTDGVQGCEFDITNNFIPGSTTITDLDNNGIAEVKMQYLTACRSDVSPSEYKLVLVENGKAYKLKGLSWLPYSPDLKFEVTAENANLEKFGPTNVDNEEDYIRTFGRYENEKEFSSSPTQFIDYARKEWIKFVKEKIGE